MKNLLILIFLSSCAGFEFDQELEYKVDSRIECHIDKFYREAAEQGITLYKNNLIVTIEEIPEVYGGAAGISVPQGRQNVIIIDPDTYEFFQNKVWNPDPDSAYYGLENLIYHELGHALLQRKHECSNCHSIMSPSLSFWAYVGESEERQVLIRELFATARR